MTRILVVTAGEIGARMAGPAIRAWNIARVLAEAGHQVVLATTTKREAKIDQSLFRIVRLHPGNQKAFANLEATAQMIVFQGHAMQQFPSLTKTDRVVVADAYDPMHLEMLEQGREGSRQNWEMLVRTRTALLNQQLSRADLVLCASERQRMFYLGQLAALGRITPNTYQDDPRLEKLISVVPFGLDAKPPKHEKNVLRGVLPGVDANSSIVLWAGGLYSWFDPLNLIRAVAKLSKTRPNVRLIFLGTGHPGLKPMGIVNQSYRLAEELGVLGSFVHFKEGWVPYGERQNFLSEADAGVSTHHKHLETEFSFRTRILDYLWAGLPMVLTEGDSFAELVAAEGLGVVVPTGDSDALAEALEKVLYRPNFSLAARENIAQVRERFSWERVLIPLLELAKNPRLAADVRAYGSRSKLVSKTDLRVEHSPGLIRDLGMAWHYLRHSGLTELIRRVNKRLGVAVNQTAREPTLLHRIIGFAGVPFVSLLAPFLMLPILARVVSEETWLAVAIGQSLGAFAALGIALGYSTIGPALVARAAPQKRPRILAVSVHARFPLWVLGALLIAIITGFVAPDGARDVAVFMALVMSLTGLNNNWYLVGLGRAGPILGYDVLPRLLATIISCVLLLAGFSVLWYPVLLIFATVLGGGGYLFREAGSELFSINRAEIVNVYRLNRTAMTAEVAAGAYNALAVTLVGLVVPIAQAARYVSADRVHRIGQYAVSALGNALQGWVADDAEEDDHYTLWARIWLALFLHTTLGVLGFAAFVFAGPWVTRLAFGESFGIDMITAAGFGTATLAISLGTALGRVALIALGMRRAFMVSVLFATAVGISAILIFGNFWGTAGAAWGLATGEVVSVAAQGFVLFKQLSKRSLRNF